MAYLGGALSYFEETLIIIPIVIDVTNEMLISLNAIILHFPIV